MLSFAEVELPLSPPLTTGFKVLVPLVVVPFVAGEAEGMMNGGWKTGEAYETSEVINLVASHQFCDLNS